MNDEIETGGFLDYAFGKMTLRIRNGQSTLEYVVILAFVIGVIIAVGVIFKPRLPMITGP